MRWIVAIICLFFSSAAAAAVIDENLASSLIHITESEEDTENGSLTEIPSVKETDHEFKTKDIDQEVEFSGKKVKIKKKHKKFLLEILMAGMLIKSALLPIAVGFLKLLTGKAFLITMMALGLVTALTFRSATEQKGTTTEVINLLGPHHHGHHRSLPENLPETLMAEILKGW